MGRHQGDDEADVSVSCMSLFGCHRFWAARRTVRKRMQQAIITSKGDSREVALRNLTSFRINHDLGDIADELDMVNMLPIHRCLIDHYNCPQT